MPSCSATGPRVGILMMNSPNIPRYAHLATLLNYMYAARHGYGFLVARCPDPQDMGKDWAWDGKNEYLFVWSKGRWLEHALRLFDVVLFLDSDAIVWDFDVRVEDKVKALMPDPDTVMVMGADCVREGSCSWTDKGNAGVVLARRGPATTDIMRRWMQPDPDCAEWKYKHTREQMCIDILRTKYFSKHIRVVPHKELNGVDGTWIRHYMAHSTAQRDGIIGEQLTRRLRELMAAPLGPDAGGPNGVATEAFRMFTDMGAIGASNAPLAAAAALGLVLLLALAWRRRRS